MSKITNKQKKFAELYLISLNATQAAIAAGYSSKTAYSIGHENLRKPEVMKYINQKMEVEKIELNVLRHRTLGELIELGITDQKYPLNIKLKALELLLKILSISTNSQNMNSNKSSNEAKSIMSRRISEYIARYGS